MNKYSRRPDDKALKTKYFIPDSVDLRLSLSIAAKYKEIKIAILNQGKKELNHLMAIKNIPKIDSKIITGYSNLSRLFSIINFLKNLKQTKMKLKLKF